MEMKEFYQLTGNPQQDIVDGHKAGVSMDDLCKEFNVSEQTIKACLKADLHPRLSYMQTQPILRLLKEQGLRAAIEQTGYTNRQVIRALRDHAKTLHDKLFDPQRMYNSLFAKPKSA